MNSQELFDKWYSGKRFNMTYSAALEVWNASREAIAIKIDNHDEFEIEHMTSCPDGYARGWIDGRNYAARQVKAAGITVKGE